MHWWERLGVMVLACTEDEVTNFAAVDRATRVKGNWFSVVGWRHEDTLLRQQPEIDWPSKR